MVPAEVVSYVSPPNATVVLADGDQTPLKPESKPNASTVIVVVAPTATVPGATIRSGNTPSATRSDSPGTTSC